MSHDHSSARIPRPILIGAGVLLATTVILSIVGRATGLGVTMTPSTDQVATRMLRFSDRADGAVQVVDAETGVEVFIAKPGTNGFLRGALRGMSRVRKLESVGPAAPYALTRWSDGRLSLSDPTTGRAVNLEVFGPDNYGVFADLMTRGIAVR